MANSFLNNAERLVDLSTMNVVEIQETPLHEIATKEEIYDTLNAWFGAYRQTVNFNALPEFMQKASETLFLKLGFHFQPDEE